MGSHPRPPHDVTGMAGSSSGAFLFTARSAAGFYRIPAPDVTHSAGRSCRQLGLSQSEAEPSWSPNCASPLGRQGRSPSAPLHKPGMFRSPCRPWGAGTPRCWERIARFPPCQHSPGHSHGSAHAKGAMSSNAAANLANTLPVFSHVTKPSCRAACACWRSHFPKAMPRFLQGALKNLGMLLPGSQK